MAAKGRSGQPHDLYGGGNRKHRAIKMDSGGETLLFTTTIIFNLAEDLKIHIVKWLVPIGVGELVV
jgi:hypothetical protein